MNEHMTDQASIQLCVSVCGPIVVTRTKGCCIELEQGGHSILLDAQATRKLSEVLMAATFGFGMTEEQD